MREAKGPHSAAVAYVAPSLLKMIEREWQTTTEIVHRFLFSLNKR